MSTSNDSSQNIQGSETKSQRYENRESDSRKYKASGNVTFVPKNSEKKMTEIEADTSAGGTQEYNRTPKTRNPRAGQFKTVIYSPKTNLLDEMGSDSLRKSNGNAKEQISKVYVQKNANTSDLSENLSSSFVSDSQSSKSGNKSKNDSPKKPDGNPGDYQRRFNKSKTQLNPKYYNVYNPDDDDSLQPRNSYDTSAKFVPRNSGGYAKPNKNLSFQPRSSYNVVYKPKNQEDDSVEQSNEEESLDYNNNYISPRNVYNAGSAKIYTPKNKNFENSGGLLLDNIDEPSDNFVDPMTSGRRSNKRSDQDIIYVKKTPKNENKEVKIGSPDNLNGSNQKIETASPQNNESNKIEEQDSGKLMDELKKNSEIMSPPVKNEHRDENGQEPINQAGNISEKTTVIGENTKTETHNLSQTSALNPEPKNTLAEQITNAGLSQQNETAGERGNQETGQAREQEQEISMEFEAEEHPEKAKRSGAPKKNITISQNESTEVHEESMNEANLGEAKQPQTQSSNITVSETTHNHISSDIGPETVNISETNAKTSNLENLEYPDKFESNTTKNEVSSNILIQLQPQTEFSRENQVEEVVLEEEQNQETAKKSGNPKRNGVKPAETKLEENEPPKTVQKEIVEEKISNVKQEKNETKNSKDEITPQPQETQPTASPDDTKKPVAKTPQVEKKGEEEVEKEKPRDSCFGGGKDGGLCQIF